MKTALEWMTEQADWCETRVDWDHIKRFMEAAADPDFRQPDGTDAAAAACLLLGLVEGAKNGENLNTVMKRAIGVKKLRANVFDPDQATIDSPAFAIVLSLVLGEITYAEAKAAFATNVQPASDRQVESWIAAIRPRAKSTAHLLKTVRKTAKS